MCELALLLGRAKEVEDDKEGARMSMLHLERVCLMFCYHAALAVCEVYE